MGLFSTRQEKLDKKFLKACRDNDVETAEELLAEGANINVKNSAADFAADTALMNAVHYNQTKMVSFLISNGADITDTDRHGRTALRISFDQKNLNIIQLLFSRTDDVNARFTSLVHACHRICNEDIIKWLLQQKDVDINAKDSDGSTALHRAAANKSYPVVKILLENGADPNAIDNDGNKPEHLAKESPGIVTLLQEKTKPALVVPSAETNWIQTEPEEISLVTDKSAIGYRQTEIINFGTRTYTKMLTNVTSGAESQVMRFFDECSDKKILRQAWQKMRDNGMNIDEAVISGSILDKRAILPSR